MLSEIEDIKNQLEIIYNNKIRDCRNMRDYYFYSFYNLNECVVVQKLTRDVLKVDICYEAYDNVFFGTLERDEHILINGSFKMLETKFKSLRTINKNNFFAVSINSGNYALFGKDGTQVTDFAYRFIEPIMMYSNSDNTSRYCDNVCKAVTFVKGYSCTFLMNSEGNKISNFFDYIHTFYDGVARVRYIDGGEGYVTINGKELLANVTGVLQTCDFKTKGVFKTKDKKLYSVDKRGTIKPETLISIKKYLTYSDSVGFEP